MKFRYILKKLIQEDKRLDFILDNAINVSGKPSTGKQVNISLDYLKQVMKTDPTTVAPAGFDWNNAGMTKNKDGKRVPKDTDKIKEDFNDVITGQYVNWLLRTFLKPSTNDFVSDYEKGTPEYDKQFKHFQNEIFEDEDFIKGLLSKFHRFQKRVAEDKRNIMNIKGKEELMNLPVRATAGGETVPLREFEGRLSSKVFDKEESDSPDSPRIRFSYPGSEVLKVGSNYTLVRIPAGGELGQKAASHFGGYHLGSSNPSSNETNWCTSPENSHNFRSYIQQAPLYIILANDDKGQVGIKSKLPKERYQIHFGNYRQYKDRLNGNIPNFVEELANGKFSEFKEYFKDEFKKGVGSSSFSWSPGKLPREIVIKLNNPNPGATSEYVKVYGREGLEEDNPNEKIREEILKVPKDCTILMIQNDTKENLFVDIPNELLNLTNLQSLNIKNIAKSLPNDFSPLSKLKFVSIIDNPNLKKLPIGFEKCNITFINLKGSLIDLGQDLTEIIDKTKKELEFERQYNRTESISKLENELNKLNKMYDTNFGSGAPMWLRTFLEHFELDRDDNGNIEEPNFWTPK
jgi:hypothetical protein